METDQLVALLLALPDAVVLVDGEANVAWANPAAERIFGLDLGDVVGTNGLELVHPDDHQFVARALTSIQGKDVGTPIEVRVRGANGWQLIELVGAPVADGRVALCLRDLTERRRFEVAHGEEARLRALVHHAGVATMLVSADGLVESVSGALTRITGLDPESVEGRALEHVLADGHDRDRLRAAIAEARIGAITPIVVGVRCHHDQVLPMQLTIVNLIDDPTVNGFVVSAHDVSEQVAVEGELRAALSLLHATLDSTADGILVVDRENHITSFNRRFVEMWRIPAAVLAARDDTTAIEFVLGQLACPEAFVAKVEELYADPEAESYDTLSFKDGRVFERFSRPQRVDGAVHGRVWSFRDLTERKRLEDELVYRAFHDQLTGLPNKARFCDRLGHASDRGHRTNTAFAVLFCDLDNFKTVNDSLGHQAGDELLVTAANTLTECLRVGDTAARLGGDEFAVLIEDLDDPSDALALAQRITESFRQQFRIGSKEVIATVSVGIAFGASGMTSDQLLRNADLAMYTAKARGKNRYECFEDQQHEAAVVRVELDADLRHAIEREELMLFYQPMVDLRTDRIVAVEALVRWNHPERGLLLPGAFIPIAEEVGLMDAMGSMLLSQACEAARMWQRADASEVAVSVNVSPRQIAGDRLVDDVARALDSSGINPSTLILEITETAMLQDTTAASRNLDAIHAMGVKLALDDFGTGFSSLTHLQQFPIDIVKIDKSFVSKIHELGSGSLAPAVIQLATSLGLTTVAEGVENVAQLRRLRELNCDLVQGFWLHRPQSAGRLCELLSQAHHETEDFNAA